MKKSIIVIYDHYELHPDGVTHKNTKWEEVEFSAENVEYDDDLTYEQNFKIFINETLESGAVLVGKGKYIPIHNIHGFYFYNDSVEKSYKTISNQNQNQNQNHKHHKHNSTRRHKPFRSNTPNTSAEASLPFKVEKPAISESEEVVSNNDYNAEP